MKTLLAVKMIYQCFQGDLCVPGDFDVAGMQLERNIYIFMTGRMGRQGNCVASQTLLPYIESEQLSKVMAPGFTLQPSLYSSYILSEHYIQSNKDSLMEVCRFAN